MKATLQRIKAWHLDGLPVRSRFLSPFVAAYGLVLMLASWGAALLIIAGATVLVGIALGFLLGKG